VTIDARSQAEPAGPFSWKTRCAAHLLRWNIDESIAHVDALSDAYKRLVPPATHRRRVAFIKSRYWIVVDELCGSSEHRIDLRFQFAPVQVRIGDDGWVRATRGNGRGLLVRAFASTALDVAVRQGERSPMEGWVSSNYGCMEPAPALVYTGSAKLPVKIATLLWPAETLDDTPAVEALRDANGLVCGLTLPGRGEAITFEADEVILS
jgi:hypothetical protein